MWELIKENQRKSLLVFALLAMTLLLLGYVIGSVISPSGGGIIGLFIALGVWLIMSFASIFGGESILLSSSKAKEVTHSMYPQLFNIVEEMKIAAGMPVMPKIYIIYEKTPNAFATGLNLKRSSIIVTTGLLEQLNRDELQGVVAHEMGHIINRDVQFMTLTGVLLGSITIISQVFLRGLFYSGGRSSRRYSSRSGGGQSQGVLIIIAVVVAILAPILAQIFYFAISRKREYLADATSVRLTRYPDGLASALEKISRGVLGGKAEYANKITAPMYIINPHEAEKAMAMNSFMSTHPPIENRIKVLRGMLGGVGANFADYQSAYARVNGNSHGLIPQSGLSEKEKIGMRNPVQEMGARNKAEQFRDIGDLARAANGFIFLTCACGMKIKLPPEFKQPHVVCPRCKQDNQVPVADIVGVGAAIDLAMQGVLRTSSKSPQQELSYKRKGQGWETFSCTCGHTMQVSPLFAGTNMKCLKCANVMHIK